MTSSISHLSLLYTENNQSILKQTPSKHNRPIQATPSPFSPSTNKKIRRTNINRLNSASSSHSPEEKRQYETPITRVKKVNSVKLPNQTVTNIQHKHTMGDRFIPIRKNNDMQRLQYLLLQNQENVNANANGNTDSNGNGIGTSNPNILHNAMLESLIQSRSTADESNEDIFIKRKKSSSNQLNNKNKFLSFTQQQQMTRKSSNNIVNDIKSIYEHNTNECQSKPNRDISLEPERILDAPQMIDDYYLNLLDWGNKNILSVCLGNSVYLWNALTGQTSLLSTANDNICSVSWMNTGTCLAVGLNEGVTDLWDVEKETKIRSLNGHSMRVSSLNWSNYLLSTGSRDSIILNHDVRIKDHSVQRLKGHSKEVCALKWSEDGSLIASGGNDNLVCLWDIRSTIKKDSIWNLIDTHERIDLTPSYVLTQHEAAVKALAFSPWQRGVLASGGGKKDHSIKYWSTDTGALINSYDTGSQVCSLIWNRHEKEIISSHGYSKNQISIWSYPKMNKIVDLVGHTNRVLYLTISPDGCTLVSGSSDETLRFWTINSKDKANRYDSKMNDPFSQLFSSMNIR